MPAVVLTQEGNPSMSQDSETHLQPPIVAPRQKPKKHAAACLLLSCSCALSCLHGSLSQPGHQQAYETSLLGL